MPIELKPCPFCGGEAKISKYNTYIANFTRADKYYGCCTVNFEHKQDVPLGYLSKEEAAVAWNRSAPEGGQDNERD